MVCIIKMWDERGGGGKRERNKKIFLFFFQKILDHEHLEMVPLLVKYFPEPLPLRPHFQNPPLLKTSKA